MKQFTSREFIKIANLMVTSIIEVIETMIFL